MPFDITVIGPKNRDYPSSLRNKKAHELFPRIWALGDLKILGLEFRVGPRQQLEML